MDQGHDDRSDEIVATEIGRAFLRAQRLADQIVADAHRKAEQITQSPVTGGGRVDATTVQSAAVMLRELDEVEHQLTSSQLEIKGLLDHYVSTYVATTDGPLTSARTVAATKIDPGSTRSVPTESAGTNGDQTTADLEQEPSNEEESAPSPSDISNTLFYSATDVTSETSSDSAVPSDGIPGKTRVDPQWAAPVQKAALTEQRNPAPSLESPAITDQPTEVDKGPRPRSSRYSGTRANIITLALALAATSVALLLVNVL